MPQTKLTLSVFTEVMTKHYNYQEDPNNDWDTMKNIFTYLAKGTDIGEGPAVEIMNSRMIEEKKLAEYCSKYSCVLLAVNWVDCRKIDPNATNSNAPEMKVYGTEQITDRLSSVITLGKFLGKWKVFTRPPKPEPRPDSGKSAAHVTCFNVVQLMSILLSPQMI